VDIRIFNTNGNQSCKHLKISRLSFYKQWVFIHGGEQMKEYAIKYKDKYFGKVILKEDYEGNRGRFGGHFHVSLSDYSDYAGILVSDTIEHTWCGRSLPNIIELLLNLMKYNIIEFDNIIIEAIKEDQQ